MAVQQAAAANTLSMFLVLLLAQATLFNLPFGVQCEPSDPYRSHTSCPCDCTNSISEACATRTVNKNSACTCKTGCSFGGCPKGFRETDRSWCGINYAELCETSCVRESCEACKPSYYGHNCAKRCKCHGGKCVAKVSTDHYHGHCRCFAHLGFEGVDCSGGAFTFHGCYDDKSVIAVTTKAQTALPMEVVLCYTIARSQPYNVTAFAVKNGAECWVGNITETQIRKMTEAAFGCGVPCAGDKDLSCGGRSAVDLYSVNLKWHPTKPKPGKVVYVNTHAQMGV